MRFLSRGSVIAIIFTLLCLLSACTDTEKTGSGESDAQRAESEISSESEDWGLGAVMPE